VLCCRPEDAVVADVPTWVWLLTVVGLLGVVALDLVVIGRRRRAVTMRDATVWVLFYIGLALAFAVGLAVFADGVAAEEFVAGYVTEYSLSVDNLFVFMIIIARFKVPPLAQDKVLYIGIVVSMVLRAVCIAAGAAALSAFNWVFYVFGAFLVYTAVKLILAGDNDDDDFQEGRVLRLVRRVLPSTPTYDGTKLVVRQDGRRLATPLVLVIVAIGIANVVFALDSIPAIFGLTTHTYIVFTANAFALMGLRQLFFLVGGLLERIVYLNIGLAVVLAFIGAKLVVEALEGSHIDHLGAVTLPHIGIVFSLTFIAATLAVTTVASLVRGRSDGPSAA
jgi:TerC family integral membrane protein